VAKVSHFRTRIAGTRHKNVDGSSRTRLIGRLEPLDRLHFEHEPTNPHDPNAVRVLGEDGRQVGYLPREVAADVVEKSRRGHEFACFVEDVIEEDDSRRLAWFVDLFVVEASPGATEAEVQRYVEEVVRPHLVGDDPPVVLEPRHASVRLPQRRGQNGCLVVLLLAIAAATALLI
jgi:hypothetical protein